METSFVLLWRIIPHVHSTHRSPLDLNIVHGGVSLCIFMCQPVCVCPNLLYSRLDFHYTVTQREVRRATHIPTSS